MSVRAESLPSKGGKLSSKKCTKSGSLPSPPFERTASLRNALPEDLAQVPETQNGRRVRAPSGPICRQRAGAFGWRVGMFAPPERRKDYGFVRLAAVSWADRLDGAHGLGHLESPARSSGPRSVSGQTREFCPTWLSEIGWSVFSHDTSARIVPSLACARGFHQGTSESAVHNHA